MTPSLGVVIPTYLREAVLVETVQALLGSPDQPDEIVLVDQTPHHETATEAALGDWNRAGAIRWIRVPKPSIPGAMNAGLRESSADVVLFLDDDILPGRELVGAHRLAHTEAGAKLVAGQVLQPGEEPLPNVPAEGGRSFRSSAPQWLEEFMGGNFSIDRSFAISLGGFDENYVGGAYRFERDFARRVLATGERIYFEPKAGIRHLRSPAGGTRSYGDHLRSADPAHSVGEYYDFLKWSTPASMPARVTGRMLRAVRNRHHLTHPWWVPVTLAAELRGFLWAIRLNRNGPRLLERNQAQGSESSPR